MKALLLGSPDDDHPGVETRQLSTRMLESLRLSGMEGKYHTIFSKTQLLDIVNSEQPDIVYCANHRTEDAGKIISIQAVMEEEQIPYIGSTSDVLDLVISKSRLKTKWSSYGVPTPPFTLVGGSSLEARELDVLLPPAGYPFILKPDREGNSRGLNASSIVFDKESLESKLKELLKQFEVVLVEKYLGSYPDIKEFTVAMIGNGANRLLMPARLTLKQKKALRIITTEDKEKHNTQASPVLDTELHGRLVSLAGKAFDVAGVRDYSRCDLMLAGGDLFAIEINGQPMIPDKWFQACASGSGLDADQYINAIFLAGIARAIHQGRSDLVIPPGMKKLLPEDVINTLL